MTAPAPGFSRSAFNDGDTGYNQGYTNNGRFGPNFQFEIASVPEPGTFLLWGVGIGGMLVLRRRKRGY